ncbi:hypothetical protein BDDG_11818 [Blastomyces dermatitidis ATCC 18188]|uniref:Uncharacterized protein n=1 Tax=Ajellomyces dermatitidis (strain ATCC 18188 / CBS 674.68) TaxID=653446 RepID=A0A0J9ELH6_AJEDA|nr:hypothetical protein BDDG_11818 [Blastomyces dermatitidis ATCC 18188]
MAPIRRRRRRQLRVGRRLLEEPECIAIAPFDDWSSGIYIVLSRAEQGRNLRVVLEAPQLCLAVVAAP